MSALPGQSAFYDRLVKIDMETRQSFGWVEEGTYPGEPILVTAPEAKDEDDGVLLSVVLAPEEGKSFLVVLSAQSMEEVARAWLPLVVPHGFHGLFERGSEVRN